MQVEVRIITDDLELGFNLVESHRFPERRPIIVPGEAIISSQCLTSCDESVDFCEVVDLVIDINEDTSVGSFASWLHGKLKVRAQNIHSLLIGGIETQIDEDDIIKAIERACACHSAK